MPKELSMRLITCLFLTFFLCMPAAVNAAELHVSATIFPVWLLLRQVADNVRDVHVHCVIPSGTGCPHDYALTPQDRKLLAQTDILVMNGLGMERFLGEGESVLRLLKPGASVIDASNGIHDLLPSGHKDAGHDHDMHHAHDHDHGSINPHIFASPALMAEMALSIGRQLSLRDAENALQYQSNAEACSQRLLMLAKECREAGAALGKIQVLAQHDIFSYMAKDMGFAIAGFIQKHEGIDPSARDLLDLTMLIRSSKAAAVITEPQYPGRSGKTLAAETGIPCIELDPLASGPADTPKDYYEQTMRRNIHILEQHLGNNAQRSHF